MTEFRLEDLIPHGKVKTTIQDDIMEVWTTNSIASIDFNLVGDVYKKHFLGLPCKVKIPFRINMTFMLDFPLLMLLIGNGHISFGSSDNHILEDIVKQTGKPNQDGHAFDNRITFGEFTDISIIYDFKELQILVNGEERFYSNKLPYMKAPDLAVMNEEGFSVGLVVPKLSKLYIRSIAVTEYDESPEIVHEVSKKQEITDSLINIDNQLSKDILKRESSDLEVEKTKSTFESTIAKLPKEYADEVKETDSYLKSLKLLKFKRIVDKNGEKITYNASDYGVSYILRINENRLSHRFSWYIITSGKPETWHRKADYMEATLNEIAKEDIALAERIFYALNDCVGCYGSRCIVKTLYTFNGQKRLTCHGVVVLRMCHEDMKDVRDFFGFFNRLMERKQTD